MLNYKSDFFKGYKNSSTKRDYNDARPLLRWNITYMRKHDNKWYKLTADQTGRDIDNALDRFRSNIKGTYQILECYLKE